jgi:inorganic pyrophosphatase
MNNDNSFLIDIKNMKDVELDCIRGEATLTNYTENHFLNKINSFIKNGDYCIESNSPVTMSENSDDGEDDEDDDVFFNLPSTNRGARTSVPRTSSSNKFKKLTYQEVEKSFDKYYENDDNYSNEFDILTTYLKGHKNVYMQSKNITQRKLNMLMIPSLLLTALITIFAPFIQKYSWSGITISAANAVITLFIALNHFFKLESAVDMYMNLSNQFDKLESSIEITNGKLIFIENKNEKNKLILEKITEVEQKINEIKETNSIIIPDEIKHIFPIISHINIFSFIKRIETQRRQLIAKFMDIKNEIRFIQYKLGVDLTLKQIDEMDYNEYVTDSFISGTILDESCGGVNSQIDYNNSSLASIAVNPFAELKNNKRLRHLVDAKNNLKNEIMHYRNSYTSIDELFTIEIKHAENNKYKLLFYLCKKNPSNPIKSNHFKNINPVIANYLNIIFGEYEND